MSNSKIEDGLNDLGAALRREPSVRDQVMRRVTEASLTPRRSHRRLISRIAALTACVIAGGVLWAMFAGNGGMGPQEAFAAAIANVEKARTFSARGVVKNVVNGKEETHDMAIMFKEPDRERIEQRRGTPVGQTLIIDYTKKRRLELFPDNKTANLQDTSSYFSVDDKSGELHPSKLETSVREEVLRLTALAVKDLGMQKLGDREVRVLRSDDDSKTVKTVWADPKTGKPLQIELLWKESGSTYTYADIRIDEELDDSLFSVELPEGYTLLDGQKMDEPKLMFAETNAKMLTKMKHLLLECYKYSSKHDNNFPAELSDLTKSGIMTEKALRTLLAAPDAPDGPAVVKYVAHGKGFPPADAVVFYEAPEFRRDGKVVAGMGDGHCEVMDEERFEEAMKK